MEYRFHGYGEPLPLEENSDRKILRSLKFEGDVKKPLDLDNIPEPHLTETEWRFPQYLRQLIIISKKCESVGNWKLVKDKGFQKLLQYSENDVLPVSKMDTYRVAKFLCGDSFMDFHLQWYNQEPRAKLMEDWLTYHARHNLLKELKPAGDEMQGMFVAAKWINGNWYRGVVKGCGDLKQIQVYYVDRGYTEMQEINTLRVLPEPLVETPPMAFRAILADIPVNSDEDAAKYGRTQLNFVSKMKNNVAFQCRIKKLIGFDNVLTTGIGKASVFLKLICPKILPDSGTVRWDNINDIIRRSLRKDKQGVVEKDVPLVEELEILEKYNVPHGLAVRWGAPPSGRLLPYKISYVVNPSLFYVEIATATDLADAAANDSKLQDFYNDSNGRELTSYKIRTHRLFTNRPYVWLERLQKTWYRVVVCRTDTSPGTCYVFRVDVGDHFVADEKDMMEIKPEFTHWPSHAIQAQLAHVRPHSGSACWSENAIVAFRNIAESSSEFLGMPLHVTDMSEECGQKRLSYGMILVDQNYRLGYSIQGRLSLLGLVKSDGFSSGNYHLAFLCHDGIPAYDQQKMFENVTTKESVDFPAILNFSVETNVPSLNFSDIVRPSVIEAKSLEIQAYFKGPSRLQPVYEQKGKREGDFCCCEGPCKIDCEHWQNKRFYLLPSFEPPYRYLKCVGYNSARADMGANIGPLTAMLGQYVGAIRISYSEGPGVFYIQMANKTKELEGMMRDIGKLVKDNPVSESDCNGSLVAVLANSEEMVPNWHRAYVTKVVGSVCKVILIDVGSLVNVPLKNVRNLPEYFWCVPLYCRRVHLDVDSKCLRNCKWTLKLNEVFNTFVRLNWGSVYLAWKPHPVSNDVEVIDYGQDVCFDAEKQQWWNGGNIPADFPIVLQNDYDKKLLYHLLHSVGINFRWENVSRNISPGEFHLEDVEKLFS